MVALGTRSMLRIFMCVIAATSIVLPAFIPSADATTNDRLAKQARALEIISDFADNICERIPLSGEQETLKLSGNAKADLSKLIKNLADLGIEGAGIYAYENYQGLIQDQIVEALKASIQCKSKVFESLLGLMFPVQPEESETEEKKRPGVWDLTIWDQDSKATIDGKHVNMIIFGVENWSESNVQDVTIELLPGPWPTYPRPRHFGGSFHHTISKCNTIPGAQSWKIYCDYIGVNGEIGFAVITDRKDGFPSGEIVVSNPDGTKTLSF